MAPLPTPIRPRVRARRVAVIAGAAAVTLGVTGVALGQGGIGGNGGSASAGAVPTFGAWAPEQQITATAFSPTGIAADGNGVRTAIWQDPTTGEILASRYATGGPWTPPVSVTPGEQPYTGPVLVAAGGDVTVVVSGYNAVNDQNVDSNRLNGQYLLDQNLKATVFRNGAWSSPVVVTSGSPAFPEALTVDPNGVATLLWTDTSRKALLSARYEGGTWSQPVDVAAGDVQSSGSFSVDADVDQGGVVTAAWLNYANTQVLSSRFSGGAWSTPVEIASGLNLRSLDVATAPAGPVVAAWADIGTTTVDAAVRSGSSWGAATTIGPGNFLQGTAWTGSTATAILSNSGEQSYSSMPMGSSWSAPTRLTDNTFFGYVSIAGVANGAGLVLAPSNGTSNGMFAFPVSVGAVGGPTALTSQPGRDPLIAMDATGAATALWTAGLNVDSLNGLPAGDPLVTTYRPAPPGPPRNVKVASGGQQTTARPGARSARPKAESATIQNGSVSLTWSAPVLDGLSPITGYSVAATSSNGGKPGSCTVTVTSCTITGLTPGKSYEFAVAARNAVGATTTPAIVQGNTPGAAGLRVTAVSSKKVLRSGATTRITMKATNGAATAATKARLCMSVPRTMRVAAARGATTSAGKACFSLGTLAAGKSATRRVTLRAANVKATSVRVTATLTASSVTPGKATARTARIRLLGPVPVTG